MSQCQTCAPELVPSNPSDFAGGGAYFEPGTAAQPCTNCQGLAGTTPPDLAPGGGVYFEVAPGPVFGPATVFNDAETAACPGGASVTIPAGSVSVFVAQDTPDNLAIAKIQANSLALNQAEAQLNLTGGTLTDNICWNQQYSRGFCVPLGSTVVVTSGTVPPGLTVGKTSDVIGSIYGTATTGGVYTFVITATPPTGSAIVYNCTLTVIAIVNPGTLCADGGDLVNYQMAASAPGGAVLTWALVNSVLPPGLSFSAAGLISGVLLPTTGLYTFTIQVSDAALGLSCQLGVSFQTGTNHPFDLIDWQSLSPTDYTYLNGVNILKAVSSSNTACGDNQINPATQDCVQDFNGNFVLDYCSGSVGGRLRVVAYGQIGDLTGSWQCKVRIHFGADFKVNDSLEITVTQGGSTLFHKLFCWPNSGGFCDVTTPFGSTFTTGSFFVGPSTLANPIVFQIAYDSADLRGDVKVSGKLLGTSICG